MQLVDSVPSFLSHCFSDAPGFFFSKVSLLSLLPLGLWYGASKLSHCWNSHKKTLPDLSPIVVIGAGPVGLFAALRVLQSLPSRPVIVLNDEGPEGWTRTQVIRAPFSVAQQLPDEIIEDMWPDPVAREKIFKADRNSDFGYEAWPFLTTCRFQLSLLHYMQKTYPTRFKFQTYTQDDDNVLTSALAATGLSTFYAMICSCGYTACVLRDVRQPSYEVPKGDGLYLRYKNEKIENFIREENNLVPRQFALEGITYAASNNKFKDVQIYTYPPTICGKVPEAVKKAARFQKNIDASLLFEDKAESLSSVDQEWLDHFCSTLKSTLTRFGITLPHSNLITLTYAERKEYFWPDITKVLRDIPLVFVGDSAGSTDYQMGMSMGRGLIFVSDLAEEIKRLQCFDERILSWAQEEWDSILKNEFLKGPELPKQDDMKWKYSLKGRPCSFTSK